LLSYSSEYSSASCTISLRSFNLFFLGDITFIFILLIYPLLFVFLECYDYLENFYEKLPPDLCDIASLSMNDTLPNPYSIILPVFIIYYYYAFNYYISIFLYINLISYFSLFLFIFYFLSISFFYYNIKL
jgi:hypothetical protein